LTWRVSALLTVAIATRQTAINDLNFICDFLSEAKNLLTRDQFRA
jgi:hypothetical protein